MIPLLLSAVIHVSAPVFEAEKVEETSVVGELVQLTLERVVLDAPEGKVEIELAKLLYLRPKDKPESNAPAAQPTVWIELTDGSTLAAVRYLVEGEKAKITLAGGGSIETSVKAIANVRIQPETPKTAAEWSRILESKPEADVLVVRNGDSIDYHQGVLHDVGEDAVRFELDGDTLPIKRVKIYGFAYRHSAGDGKSPAIGYFLDRDGSRWAVANFTLGESLQWTTPCGVKVERPLADVRSIDFSLGKVLYLSDLTPESAAWTPYFGQGEVSPALQRFYAPRQDRNFESHPLQLRKKVYSKGLAVHSRTEIVYRLPGSYARFKAVAGIDDTMAAKGNVRLTIRGDERVLFDSPIRGADAPLNIDLDVAGARRMTIVVDYGDTRGIGEHLILGNARIFK
jgi:hypothetical protein